jgi:hypothetical protein
VKAAEANRSSDDQLAGRRCVLTGSRALGLWDKLWPGQIPPSPVTAVTVPGNRFTLEGHHLFIIEVGRHR